MIKAKAINLRKTRLEKGLNQVEVCAGVGLSNSTYSQIESKKKCLRPKTAKRICDYFQKPFEELFEVL